MRSEVTLLRGSSMTRSIEFIIPGIPEVLIQAVEQSDGTILFTATVEGDADLRGLFFDVASVVEGGLTVTGTNVTEFEVDTINLGQGVNMNGDGRDEYDIGVEFGTPGDGMDEIEMTSFTLASADGSPLTLDLIAQVEFGARLTGIDGSGSAKNTVVAPAAPDAIDDVAETLEDVAVTIDAVSNDTDADGDALTITGLSGVDNGTAEIVDNKIVFLADEHWSGTETFTYDISDGDGGKDCAEVTVTVVAVADAPIVSVEALAGASVQEVILKIDSSLVDMDGSESLSLEISGLPAGVTASVTEITNPGATEYVTLTLPEDQSFDFDVTVTATATEASNGDMASSTAVQDVVLEWTDTSTTLIMEANDQNQWGPGEEFTFDDVREIGFDTGTQSGSGSVLGAVDYTASAKLAAGLRSDLHFGGGEIDADVPYDLTFETTFNKTTDVLQLNTSAFLADGGGFMTDGPELTYNLDFYVDFFASLDVDLLGFDVINPRVGTGGEQTVPIIDFDSDTSPSLSASFPFGISGELTWPNLEVTNTAGTYSGFGESEDFLNINLDIDDLLADVFLGGVNPLSFGDSLTVLGQTAGFSFDILDADLFVGAGFEQTFDMAVGNLTATLEFEDGSSQAFTFGDSLVFENASDMDVDGDGEVEFNFVFDVEDTMVTNDTDMDFDGGWNFDVLKGSAYLDTTLGSTSASVGPVVDLGGVFNIATIDVYSDTFELNFEEQDYMLVA